MPPRPDDLRPRSPNFLLNEVPRPLPIRSWRNAPWLSVMAVCFGALMAQIDASIVTVAYPTLQRHFNVSLGAVTWVGLGYLLTVVATLVSFGRLSDMWGRKLVYVYGFVVFLLGSLLCGIAPNLGVLVAARVVQGLGGAMLQANSVAIVVLSLPVAARTKGLGLQAAAQALGLALGPTIGGLLLGVASWRWLFLINIPVGLLALLAAGLFVPRSRDLSEPRPLDWRGTGLLVLCVLGLLGSLSFAGALGWSSPLIIGGFVLSAVGGLGFFAQEHRAADPLVSPALLRARALRRGLGAAGLSYLALYGLLLTVPFLVERGLDKSATTAGFILLALPLAIGLASTASARLVRAIGARRTLLLAGAIGSAGLAVAALGHGEILLLILGLGITGVGIGIFNTANNSQVMAEVPTTQTAVGSAMLNTTRGFGTALGLAAGGAVFVALGGASSIDSSVSAAFAWSTLVLLGVFALAGLLAAQRSAEG